MAGQRILELPTAAVYLAEAEWRAGDQDAADRAADIALDAARQQGSNHVLLQALADFPAVVARRIDAEAHADSAWHGIGRALAAQGVRVPTQIPTAIELVEFGGTAIILDGEEVRPILAKCYELLGFLAARNGAPASRDELLNALFDARDDESARSYLRKTIIGVRRLLPPDVLSVSADGRVALSPDIVLASESVRLEQELAAAARLQGSELVTATEHALAPLATRRILSRHPFRLGRRPPTAACRAGNHRSRRSRRRRLRGRPIPQRPKLGRGRTGRRPPSRSDLAHPHAHPQCGR